MHLISILQNYGFTEKEAKVYLAALELGTAPASRIGRIAGENRSTTYTVLQKLQTQGVATGVEKSGNTYFSVIDLETLKNNLKQRYELFEQSLPELMALTKKYDNRPKVQFFDGFEGLKTAYNDLLEPKGGTIYSFTGIPYIEEKLRKRLDEEFVPQRVKNKVFAKVILESHELTYTRYVQHDKKSCRETIIIDDPVLQIADEVVMYGENKVLVAMFSPEQMSALIIESSTLYNTLTNIHKLVRKLWSEK